MKRVSWIAASVILVCSVVAVAQTSAPSLDAKYDRMLYTLVRVKTKTATGSGTVLYSEDRAKTGRHRTFVMTNHHVVESTIRIEKKWNNLLQRYENVEVLDPVIIEVFRYLADGRENGRVQYDANVVAYEADEDLALLELTVGTKMGHVASILPTDATTPRVFEGVYAVGCSLSETPIPSHGEITSINKIIDRKCFWMISAPIVFGNSGGAVFLERPDGFWWVGVPSRVAAAGNQIIPHMAYITPLNRIVSWIKQQHLTFLVDPTKTPEESFKERESLRKEVPASSSDDPKARHAPGQPTTMPVVPFDKNVAPQASGL